MNEKFVNMGKEEIVEYFESKPKEYFFLIMKNNNNDDFQNYLIEGCWLDEVADFKRLFGEDLVLVNVLPITKEQYEKYNAKKL